MLCVHNNQLIIRVHGEKGNSETTSTRRTSSVFLNVSTFLCFINFGKTNYEDHAKHPDV